MLLNPYRFPASGGATWPLPAQTVSFVDGAYLNQTNASNSRVIIMPSATAIGDLMLATVYHSGLVTPPSGWALYSNLVLPGLSSFVSIYFKVAVSGDPGASLSWSQNVTGNFTLHYTVVRGASPLTILSHMAAVGTASDASIALPGAHPTNQGQFLLTEVGRVGLNSAFPATAGLSSGWDTRSVTSELSLPIKFITGSRAGVLNLTDVDGTAAFNPASVSPAWRAVEAVIGYAVTPPALGAAWPEQGGFYAGEYTVDGATFYLVDGGYAAEASGVQWKTANTATTGTTGTGNGVTNCGYIVAIDQTIHAAAQHCLNWNGGGFKDWYLPSLLELDAIRTKLWTSAVGVPTNYNSTGSERFGRSGSQYWTSTTAAPTTARRIDLSSGSATDPTKLGTNNARPIRRVLKV